MFSLAVFFLSSILCIVVPMQSKEEIAREVAGGNAVIVKFFTPWCGHCKTLAPEYEKASEECQGNVVFGEVNCDDHGDLCGQYGVQGFPTVKVFYSQNGAAVEKDYGGERTAEGIGRFIGGVKGAMGLASGT
ncbi:MAG: protein disulfide isomerase [Amphiamblys sp. WSBS2006]|nr:MAG: protein disulfide isomerase [Amphiamblys sp. WSBS2006]